MTRMTKPNCDHAHPKLFNQLLIFMNLFQNAKSQAISSFCSRCIVDLKIMQYD